MLQNNWIDSQLVIFLKRFGKHKIQQLRIRNWPDPRL
jgi:hypothetical protein